MNQVVCAILLLCAVVPYTWAMCGSYGCKPKCSTGNCNPQPRCSPRCSTWVRAGGCSNAWAMRMSSCSTCCQTRAITTYQTTCSRTCQTFAAAGGCSTTGYMKAKCGCACSASRTTSTSSCSSCRQSCSVCKYWATQGACSTSSSYMSRNCACACNRSG